MIFLGPPGTGKTPLAVALGLKAIHQGYRTLLTSALGQIASLTKASAENRSGLIRKTPTSAPTTSPSTSACPLKTSKGRWD